MIAASPAANTQAGAETRLGTTIYNSFPFSACDLWRGLQDSPSINNRLAASPAI